VLYSCKAEPVSKDVTGDWMTSQNVENGRRELHPLLSGWLHRSRWAGRNIERTISSYTILGQTTKDKSPVDTFEKIILKWILTNWDTKFWTWFMSFRSVHLRAVSDTVTDFDLLYKAENLWIGWAVRTFSISSLLHGVNYAQWHQPITDPQGVGFSLLRGTTI
jgi:hypothetical protein